MGVDRKEQDSSLEDQVEQSEVQCDLSLHLGPRVGIKVLAFHTLTTTDS